MGGHGSGRLADGGPPVVDDALLLHIARLKPIPGLLAADGS